MQTSGDVEATTVGRQAGLSDEVFGGSCCKTHLKEIIKRAPSYFFLWDIVVNIDQITSKLLYSRSQSQSRKINNVNQLSSQETLWHLVLLERKKNKYPVFEEPKCIKLNA